MTTNVPHPDGFSRADGRGDHRRDAATGVESFAVGEVRSDWPHDVRLVLLSDYEVLDSCLRETSERVKTQMAANVRLAQKNAELCGLLRECIEAWEGTGPGIVLDRIRAEI